MDSAALYPKSVLKVNLGCCQACVVRLKKLLSNMPGVSEFDIDVKNKLVTVIGRAHPQLIVEKIRQKKKRAEVLSYETPNSQNKKEDFNTEKTLENGINGDHHQKEEKTQENGRNCDHHKEKKTHKKGKEKDIFCTFESHPHESEPYVPPKPSALDECRDPYCKIHYGKKTYIRAIDSAPMVKFQQPPQNRPRFLPPPPPPPPRYLPPPPPPPPRYLPPPPRYYSEDYPEDRHRLQHIEPIVYDRPLPQYDPWYNQRPPLPPPPGCYGPSHAYTGNY